MPKATLPPWLSEIHGKMGDVVFKRTKKGEVIVTKAPDMSKVKWSPAQKAYRQRFKKAIAYARAAMANPKIRRVYEKKAARQKRVPFRVAVSDYLKGNDLFRKPKRS